MKGMAKLILGLVGLVVILIVAAGVLLGFFIDPNDYKADIEKLALDKAGLELSIDGDIDWTLFPWLGLELNGVQARYPDRPQLARLEQAKVAVKLLPLLSRQVEMSSVEVTGLDLSLVRQADGSDNWTPAAAAAAAAGEASAAQPGTASVAGKPSEPTVEPVSLDIEGIQISDGRLSLDDRQAQSQLTLLNLSVTTGQVQAGAWFPLEIAFSLQKNAGGQELDASIQLQAEAQLDPRAQQYRLRGLDSTIGVQTASLGDQPVEVRLGGDLSADLGTELARIDNLSLKLANLSAAGSVSVQDFKAPKFGGELKVAQFDARALLASLGQPVPETADANALTRVSLGTAINGPANTLSLAPLTLTLDDSHFNGRLGFDLGSGALSLQLDGDQLDADRYLPPKSAKAAPSQAGDTGAQDAKPAGGAYSKEPVIPVEALQNLELDASLGLKQLTASGIAMRDVELAVSAHGGVANFSRINANLFGGGVRSSAVLDMRQQPVRLSVKKNISGLQIGTLLQTLTGEPPRLTGTLSSQADVSARGRSVDAIVNSLSGNANFNVSDGTVEGISMAQTICQGFNTLGSLGVNTQQVDRSTPFANLGGNFRISNGVISNQDLAASLDAMALKGRGSVNLPQRSLDYRLGLSIEENLFKQSCSVNNKIQGVEWPVNCKGSFDTPPAKLCRPDLSVFEDLVKQQLKQEVQAKVEEEVDQKLQDRLGEEAKKAKDLIKGLFGN
ncbi:MAG: AsmA family protein [Oceanospirillaceae bacterium]|nr:AsmA family protein [Oceanospirillaceae bacterium]